MTSKTPFSQRHPLPMARFTYAPTSSSTESRKARRAADRNNAFSAPPSIGNAGPSWYPAIWGRGTKRPPVMRVPFAAAIGGLILIVSPTAAQPPNTPSSPSNSSVPQQILGKTLDEWIRQIDNPDPSVREHAIRVAMLFGPSARRAIPALVRQVTNTNDFSPLANAIIALGQLMPAEKDPAYARSAVDALTQALNHQQAIIRYQAATAIRNC